MMKAIRSRFKMVRAGALLAGLLWAGPAIAGGGAAHYQAGNLSGYPSGGPTQNTRESPWQDQSGTHYHGGPPKGSWRAPWIEEQEREERSWNMLDNMILDVSPGSKRPKSTVPDDPSESE